MKRVGRRQQLAWAMYDWGNSAFATTVLAGFFPLFYKQYWRPGVEAAQSTFELGAWNTGAGLLVAFLAPVLGAVADRAAGKKLFLFGFALLGIGATAALAATGASLWVQAGLLFAISIVGFQGSIVFYDALLTEVARPEEVDWISALGYALGYLGGGLLFALNVLMTLKPYWFGLRDGNQAIRFSFLTVAAWWMLFALPLLLWVRESPSKTACLNFPTAVRAGLQQLGQTFRRIRLLKPVILFLAAYIIYIDGVGSVIKMAVDFGLSLGFSRDALIKALLLVQFVGFPAALLFGHLGSRLGARRSIFLGLAVYVGAIVWGARMSSEREFYILAIIIGLVQGGVQSLSRSYFARLIPQEQAAEFFGFYNMVGKFATLLGPLLMGVVSKMTGSTRWGIASLILLFLAGGALLSRVKPETGAAQAHAVE